MNIRPNILIVDDEETNRELLKSILEDTYNIFTAKDGKEAVEFLLKHEIYVHLVLLDLIMPVMDGFDVLNIIKSHDELNGTPVIIVSGDSNIDTILKAYNYGALDYFGKPFVAEIVKRCVANTLEIANREYIDTVTGGFNRKGFLRQADIYFMSEERNDYSVIFFDIKNFRAYNEVFGNEVGDELLRLFSKVIMDSFLAPVVMARGEMDHFMALVPKTNIHFKLLGDLLTYHYELKTKSATIHATAGICDLSSADSATDALERARMVNGSIDDEYAMPYAVFNAELSDQYNRKLNVLSGFDKAIENNEFHVYYQPVIEAKTGKIASCEALVRWVSPEYGFISPGLFIPTLEQNGYVSKLDEYVATRVYSDIINRKEAGKVVVPVSINLSWMDFYDVGIRTTIKQLLEKNPDLNKKIRYEVTESSLAALKSNSSFEFLKFLNENDIKLLLDDFGSGYSSYSMLAKHSFDILKIDMSMTRQLDSDPNMQAIIANIIKMCHEIGIRVVAEGAETSIETDFLRDHDCDYIQGYFYSKPLSRMDIEAYIDEHAEKGLIKTDENAFE